jgi:hypothetical protein
MFCVYTPLMTLFYRLVDVSLKFYQNQYSNWIMASLEDVSLLNPDNIAVTKEHLKTCCKPVYHPRRFKSKGTLLILVWIFLCMMFMHA